MILVNDIISPFFGFSIFSEIGKPLKLVLLFSGVTEIEKNFFTM